MSLNAASMASRIHTYIDAVPPTQVTGAGSIDSYRVALMTAMCQGIIDEIHAAAVVSTTDSRGDTCTNGTVA